MPENNTIDGLDDLNVLNAFKTVLEHINRKESTHSLNDPYSDLKYMYDLTEGGVEAIAYLLHFFPGEIAESKLTFFLERRHESAATVLDDLKGRGFIKERRMSSGGNCFSVTDEAYIAFRFNRKFGTNVFRDCFSALKYTPPGFYFSHLWLRKFKASFELPGNRYFKKAAESLELSSLSADDQLTFWAVARFFQNNFADVFNMDEMNEMDEENHISEDYLKESLGRLAKTGLVILLPIDNEGKSNSEYVLSPKAAGLLFHSHDELIKYDEIAKYANIIKCRDIDKKELFFSREAQIEINNLRAMISQKGFERAKHILERKKRASSIQSLLWGPPGTGKTETVKQLALESGRDIILFDMAKVTGSLWGATEKYYRALFRAYNYIAVISNNVPILLLNEADDILSKRLTVVERSIDKSENTIANILLQEIENLNGILIATTNLIDNLDPAFDRRFLFKTQLIKPEASARRKIWRSSIPELTESEAKELADKFEMSGAQINNVVTKRDLAELYFEGDRGFAFISKLCESELSTENGSKSSRSHIGFKLNH